MAPHTGPRLWIVDPIDGTRGFARKNGEFSVMIAFVHGGRPAVGVVLEPAKVWISFKCTPEEFAELTERPGIIPAPYAARYHWVALETKDALTTSELKQQLRRSYDLVVEKLPRKIRANLR